MRLSASRIRRLCHAQGLSLSALLRVAQVSRTAYYSLARRDTVLPGSVVAIAAALGVVDSEILEPSPADETVVHRRLKEARAILAREPDLTFENVWHTLTLLELPPLERLRRSLIRGRTRKDNGKP